MIQRKYLPDRDRGEVKNKFERENTKNAAKVTAALTASHPRQLAPTSPTTTASGVLAMFPFPAFPAVTVRGHVGRRVQSTPCRLAHAHVDMLAGACLPADVSAMLMTSSRCTGWWRHCSRNHRRSRTERDTE